MHLFECPSCQSRINPVKHWLKINKYIKCSKCDNLSTIERTNIVGVGVGGAGYTIYYLAKNYFDENTWLALLAMVPVIVLVDFVCIRIRKVSLIEANSFTAKL